MTAPAPELAPEHRALLEASGIAPEVAAERGYFTASRRSELARSRVCRLQQIVPALVLPCWGVDGAIVNYQARPDRPRVDAERGREVKYETVAGSHPPRRPAALPPELGRTPTPLWITEGIRKGDALARPGSARSRCSASTASASTTGTGSRSTSATPTSPSTPT